MKCAPPIAIIVLSTVIRLIMLMQKPVLLLHGNVRMLAVNAKLTVKSAKKKRKRVANPPYVIFV
jgi:hypothetical protein